MNRCIKHSEEMQMIESEEIDQTWLEKRHENWSEAQKTHYKSK